MNYNYSYSGAPSFGGAGAAFIGCYFLFLLVIEVLVIFLYWRIFSKAGYSGAWALLALIPGFGALFLMFMLAFGNWPALGQRPPSAYVPPTGGYTPPPTPGYQPPPPTYQPPAPPMNAPAAPPAYAPPQPPAPAAPAAPPAYAPPQPPAAPPAEQPPAPPAQ